MEGVVLVLGATWIWLMSASTERINKAARGAVDELTPMTTNDMQSYNDNSGVWRFNESGRGPVRVFVGQFGLGECHRHDQTGTCNRTWDIGLEKF